MPLDLTRIQQLESSTYLNEFASGVGLNSLRPCQTFLAPPVRVYALTGPFKKFTKDSRLVLPSLKRTASSNDAVQLALQMDNNFYNCVVHAGDCPLDEVFGKDLEDYLIADAMTFLSDVRSQVTENETINQAIASAGAGVAAQFSSPQTDPVKFLDAQILNVMRTAKTGDIAVLFDPLAWDLFKNNQKVIERTRGGLSWDTNPALFHGNAEYRTCYSIYDENPFGMAQNIQFQLPANSVFIFARSAKVSRSDPSWMKTFWFCPGDPKKETADAGALPDAQPKRPFRLAASADGRKLIVRLDFSIDIQVTNTTGAQRLNVN